MFDRNNMSPGALEAWEALNAAWGQPLQVNSAYRSPEHNRRVGGAKHSQHTHGNAFDINVANMPREQRLALIAEAQKAGFQGIGVYDNALHFDVGPQRAWGPSYRSDSIPDWARGAVSGGGGQSHAHGGLSIQPNRVEDRLEAGHMEQPQQQQERRGLLGGLWDSMNLDEEDRYAMAMALSGMTLNGNEGLQRAAAFKMKSAGDRKTANKTAQWLRSQGRDDLAQAVEAGALDGKSAVNLSYQKPDKPRVLTMGDRLIDETGRVIADFSGDSNRTVQWLRDQGREDLAGAVEAGMPADEAMTLALKPRDQSAKEEQIDRIVATGIDRNTAVLIADGVLTTSTNPQTGETVIIDKSTGKVVGQAGEQAGRAAQATSERPPLTENAEDSFGIEGLAKGMANAGLDVIGAEPAFPGVQQGQAAFNVLGEELMSDIAQGWPRQPPAHILESIRKLTPRSGSAFEGPNEAQTKLTALRGSFTNQLETVDRSLEGQLTPNNRQELEARRNALLSAIGRVDAALGSFGSTEQNRTSSGVTWRVK